MNANTQFDALPEISLDSVESAEFKIAPEGRYAALVSASVRPNEKNQHIVTLKYVVTDTLALADESQTPVKNGEKILENCEYSAEKLKWIKRKLEIFAAKAELPIGTPVNTILEAMQDIPVEFTLKHRKYLNRDGEVRYSAQIQDSAFVVML